MTVTLKECTPDDLAVLQELSCITFSDTFGHMNTPANMKAYLEKAFNAWKLYEELSNSSSAFYFLYADERLAGYMKLNEYEAQTDIYDPQSLEIERIYLLKEFQGKGLGSFLIKNATDIAVNRNKSYIWLGVWEKNHKAIMFYQKHGFYIAGTHSFFLGDEEQTDYIMRKDLAVQG